jgi:hypothetical protein
MHGHVGAPAPGATAGQLVASSAVLAVSRLAPRAGGGAGAAALVCLPLPRSCWQLPLLSGCGDMRWSA